MILLILMNNYSGQQRSTACNQCSADTEKRRVFAVRFCPVQVFNCQLIISRSVVRLMASRRDVVGIAEHRTNSNYARMLVSMITTTMLPD